MTIDTILCVDVETTGLVPGTDTVIEVGAVHWSITHGCVLSCWSELVIHDANAAEAINRISVGALGHGLAEHDVFAELRQRAQRADAVVAHRASFDSAFLPDLGKPWVCSKAELKWPMSRPGDHLVGVALAHGVGVTRAHRALTDCLLIAYSLEAVHSKYGVDYVRAMFADAMLPRKLYQGMQRFEDNQLAKDNGFLFEKKPAPRWLRRATEAEVAALPFPCREVV